MKQSFFSEAKESNLSNLSRYGNTALKSLQRSQPQNGYHGAGIRSKTQMPVDPLLDFQQQLDSLAYLPKNRNSKSNKKHSKARDNNALNKQLQDLKSELISLKGQINNKQSMKQETPAQEKLDSLLNEIKNQKNLSIQVPDFSNYSTVNPMVQTSMHNPLMQQTPQAQTPQNYPFYYPFPMPIPQYPPAFPRKKRRRKYQSSSSQSDQSPQQYKPRVSRSIKSKTKSRIYEPKRDLLFKKFRKVAYAVAFTTLLKSETRKLSANRKSNLKKFWKDKFESQISHIKNWLLDSYKYSLSIILQKSFLSFKLDGDDINFHATAKLSKISQKSLASEKVKSVKTKTLMQIVYIGLTKLHELSNPQHISMFVELIVYLCRRNSFAIGRFWSAYEMEQLCLSEQFGFIRMDQSIEKFLIAVLIFVKVLIFNMFLQPYKFDSENFPKNKQPLHDNMVYIGAIHYHMIKEIIEGYLATPRNEKIFKPGNWLKLANEYIVECSQPMIYGDTFPEENEYISGLPPSQQFDVLKNLPQWKKCTQKIRIIIDKIHIEMFNKAKLMRKNLKYKLYN